MGFLAIFCGARAAHGGEGSLYEKLKAAGELDHWHTAVQYHMLHAVVLLVLTLGVSGTRTFTWAWRLILAGIILFSGSLYAAAMGVQGLKYVTPVGGLCLMAGWVAVALAAKPKP